MRGVFFVKKVENGGVFCRKKVENGVFCKKSKPFLNAGCIMYSISIFILHFTHLGGAYAPNAPPCLRAWFLGEGTASPLPTTYGVWEGAGAGAEHRPLKGFLAFYRGVAWLLLELIGRQVRGDGPFAPSPPLQSAYGRLSFRNTGCSESRQGECV